MMCFLLILCAFCLYLVSTLSMDAVDHFAAHSKEYNYGGHYLLAQTVAQFKAQLADHILTYGNASAYTNSNVLHAIMRALFNSHQTLYDHRLPSDRSFEAHAIGAASCGIHIGLSPLYVAGLLAHGIYIKRWSNQLLGWRKYWTPCELRRRTRILLGADIEEVIWLYTGLLGQGSHPQYVRSWYNYAATYSNAFIGEDQQLLLMALCDEYEEHIGGEQWWSDNIGKNRGEEYFAQSIYLAENYGNKHLVHIGWTAFNSTRALFMRGQPYSALAAQKRENMSSIVKTINGVSASVGDQHQGSGGSRIDFLRKLLEVQRHHGPGIMNMWRETKALLKSFTCQNEANPPPPSDVAQALRNIHESFKEFQ
jgi:hypothetical protein